MNETILVGLAGMILCVTLAGCATAAGPVEGAGVGVDYAWFCPDKPLPYKYRWWEGFGEFFPKHSRLGGTFHAYLVNHADVPVRVRQMQLNGTPLEELHADLRVAWWRTMPNPIPAGGMAEVIIRLKHPPEAGEQRLRFETDRGPVMCEVPLVPPRMEIAYVAFSPALDRVYVYVEKYTDDEVTLSGALVNGRDMTSSTTFHQPGFYRNLSLVQIDLAKPMREGDRPIIKVTSKQGEVAEVKVRAWASDFFTLAAFGIHDSMDAYPDLHLNTSLTVAGDIHAHYLEQLVEYGYKALPGGDSNANYYYWTKDIESVNAYFFFDEPDCKDHPSNLPRTASVAKFRRLTAMEGLGSMALLMEDYARRVRHIAPDKGTFMIINGTYRPDNYFMYGKIPDIPAPDVYPHTSGDDPYVIYQGLNAGRLASMPRPFHSVPDFVQQAHGKHYWKRTVTPEELDLRVLYSVAAGAKGLIWYSFGGGSLKWTDEVKQRMALMNGRMEIAGPVLEIGHPVPDELAVANHEKLMVRTLQSGPDTIVVTLINTNYQATGEGYSYEAIPNAQVRVTLPESMKISSCFAAFPDKSVDIPFKQDGNELVIEFGDVETGDILICTGDAGLKDALRQRFNDLVTHREGVRDRRKARFERKLTAVADERYRVTEASMMEANAVADEALWNPLDQDNNAIQWKAEKPGEKKGAAWKFSIEKADVPYLIGLHLLGRMEGRGGNVFDIYFKDADGKLIKTDAIEIASVHGAGAFGDYAPLVYPFEWEVKFPKPGEYTLELRQGRQRHRWFPSTARVARHIYVKPKTD